MDIQGLSTLKVEVGVELRVGDGYADGHSRILDEDAGFLFLCSSESG